MAHRPGPRTPAVGANRRLEMKLRPPQSAPAAGRAAAFTMVEIAICIAVVGFALVAILGVLPTGFDVQRRNRENTIIHQEGNLWLETLRSGANGLDYLTNHVDAIAIGATPVTQPRAFDGTNGFRTGREIVGLLTQPAVIETGRVERIHPRRVTAFVRAVTGSAGDKTPRNEFAFTYRLTSELTPYPTLALHRSRQPAQTNFAEPGLSPDEQQRRRWSFEQVRKAEFLRAGTHELRLTLEWPMYFMNNRIQVGDNRKTFRTLVTGELLRTNDNRLGELNWLRPFEPVHFPWP